MPDFRACRLMLLFCDSFNIALTEHKYVPPTRTYSDGRGIQPISSPTDITFLRQIKTKAAAIESE